VAGEEVLEVCGASLGWGGEGEVGGGPVVAAREMLHESIAFVGGCDEFGVIWGILGQERLDIEGNGVK
jgi:hypothetical protein